MSDSGVFYNVNRVLRENQWTLALSCIVGLVVAFILFYIRPVVEMQGQLVTRTSDSATLHVWGKKVRECKFLDIAGYAVKESVMTDAKAVKLGIPEDGSTKPMGTFDLGQWLVFPTGDADSVQMFVTHSCAPGDIRVTKIADVKLSPNKIP